MTDREFTDKATRLREHMLRIAERYLGNRMEAEDIVQDAMLKLWTKRNDLEAATLEAFSGVVAKRLSLDRLRSMAVGKSKRISIDEALAMQLDNDQDVAAETEQRSQMLLNAITRLPSQQQILLRLRYFNGKDVDSIAMITGGSTDSVYKSLSRARMALYRILAVAMVLVLLLCLPFMIGGNGEQPVARVASSKAAVVTNDTMCHRSPVTPAPQVASAPTTMRSRVRKAAAAPAAENELVLYSDVGDDDVHFVATLHYKKTSAGDYKVLSCNYEPVSDSGRKAVFIPEEEIRCSINASMANIDINGTLTYEGADGQPVEKYVSVNRVVFNDHDWQ